MTVSVIIMMEISKINKDKRNKMRIIMIGTTLVPVTDGTIRISEDMEGAESYSDLAGITNFEPNSEIALKAKLAVVEIEDIPDDASFEQLWGFGLWQGFEPPTEHQIVKMMSTRNAWLKERKRNPSASNTLIPFQRSRAVFTFNAMPMTINGKTSDKLSVSILEQTRLVEQNVVRAILRKTPK